MENVKVKESVFTYLDNSEQGFFSRHQTWFDVTVGCVHIKAFDFVFWAAESLYHREDMSVQVSWSVPQSLMPVTCHGL